jgi:hypothetical protein
LDAGFYVELQEPVALTAREKLKRRKPRGESTEAEHWGGPIRSSVKARNGAGVKGLGQAVVRSKQLETGRC